jgi:hypothetical protein
MRLLRAQGARTSGAAVAAKDCSPVRVSCGAKASHVVSTRPQRSLQLAPYGVLPRPLAVPVLGCRPDASCQKKAAPSMRVRRAADGQGPLTTLPGSPARTQPVSTCTSCTTSPKWRKGSSATRLSSTSLSAASSRDRYASSRSVPVPFLASMSLRMVRCSSRSSAQLPMSTDALYLRQSTTKLLRS